MKMPSEMNSFVQRYDKTQHQLQSLAAVDDLLCGKSMCDTYCISKQLGIRHLMKHLDK